MRCMLVCVCVWVHSYCTMTVTRRMFVWTTSVWCCGDVGYVTLVTSSLQAQPDAAPAVGAARTRDRGRASLELPETGAPRHCSHRWSHTGDTHSAGAYGRPACLHTGGARCCARASCMAPCGRRMALCGEPDMYVASPLRARVRKRRCSGVSTAGAMLGLCRAAVPIGVHTYASGIAGFHGWTVRFQSCAYKVAVQLSAQRGTQHRTETHVHFHYCCVAL